MYLIPHTDWRVLYFIGAIPLLTIPFFIKQFPESLSYYLARKQVGKVVEILNQVKPDGHFTEKDDYQLHSAQKDGKGFPVKKLFTNKRAFTTIAFWLAIFCTMMMAYGLNTWLPKIMQSSGFSITSSLSFNIMLCVGQIAGTLIGGYLAGKIGYRKVLVSLYLMGVVTFIALSITTNVTLVYFLIFLGGASTVGAMNLGNPYITEFYPREIRSTGMGYAQAIGRIGSVLAPTLIAMLLVTGNRSKDGLCYLCRTKYFSCSWVSFSPRKYGSFDKLVEDDQVHEEFTENVNERVIQS